MAFKICVLYYLHVFFKKYEYEYLKITIDIKHLELQKTPSYYVNY